MPKKKKTTKKRETLSSRIDGLTDHVHNLSKGQKRLVSRQGRVEEKIDTLEVRQGRVEERIDSLENGQKEFREELNSFKEELSSFKATVIRLYSKQEQRAEREREENKTFRQQMLTLMDRVAVDYNNFNTEKIALGSSIDRIQTQVDQLGVSDSKQNAKIETLESRVDRLESNRG